MKVSGIKGYVPASELRTTGQAAESQGEVAPAAAEQTPSNGDPDRAGGGDTGPTAIPPLMDFEPGSVRNDFSSKYRRAALALEGTIYRLEQSQRALASSSEDADGVVAFPENSNLQQTADGLAMLAHLESVRFKKSV